LNPAYDRSGNLSPRNGRRYRFSRTSAAEHDTVGLTVILGVLALSVCLRLLVGAPNVNGELGDTPGRRIHIKHHDLGHDVVGAIGHEPLDQLNHHWAAIAHFSYNLDLILVERPDGPPEPLDIVTSPMGTVSRRSMPLHRLGRLVRQAVPVTRSESVEKAAVGWFGHGPILSSWPRCQARQTPPPATTIGHSTRTFGQISLHPRKQHRFGLSALPPLVAAQRYDAPMTGTGSRIGLMSLTSECRDAEVGRAALKMATVPGVIRSTGFVRETPADQPAADTFRGRGLVVAELRGDGGEAETRLAAVGGTALGAFSPIASQSRRDGQTPDFATAAGILLVMVNNTDPGRDDEFNQWYDNIHVGDVTGAAGFWGGMRYRNVAPEPGRGSSRYLALYCTDVPDVLAEQMKVRAASEGMVLWPAIHVVHNAAYRRVG
jgi:hypothetical protein